MSRHQAFVDEWRSNISEEADLALTGFAAALRVVAPSSVWRPELRGTVIEAVGTTLRVIGLSLGVGDLCEIELEQGAVLLAETVGISGRVAMLMPYGELAGIKAGA